MNQSHTRSIKQIVATVIQSLVFYLKRSKNHRTTEKLAKGIRNCGPWCKIFFHHIIILNKEKEIPCKRRSTKPKPIWLAFTCSYYLTYSLSQPILQMNAFCQISATNNWVLNFTRSMIRAKIACDSAEWWVNVR